jgi:hypothetical protein
MKYGILIGLVISSLAWSQESLDGYPTQSSVERLPISGLVKVTESDGTVKYMSDDRRFVFVGKMYDLWKGDVLEAGVAVSQKIDFNRNGVSIEKIGFPVGSVYGRNTLFIAPECQDCKDLLRAALETKGDDLNIVLLSSTQKGSEQNSLVWCSKDRVEGLRTIYLDGNMPSRSDINMSCDRFGLMLAEQAASVFGIGQLPMFVDSEGNGFTGEQAIYAVTN